MSELPSTYLSFGTMETNSVGSLTVNSTLKTPTPNATPVQLPEREHPERVSDRDAGQQGGAAEIGADHGSAPPAAPVYPGARVQAEQQGRHPHEGGEIAHLGRGGI